MGWLLLTLQGNPMTSSMITPTVQVNGWRVPAHYGANVIPVHAGPNRIDVNCRWLRPYGRASLETTVPDGGQVPVFYAAPMHQFSRGAIGHHKQRRPGGIFFSVMLVVVLALVVAVFALPFLLV
ncbi:MAG TPA: hypothetical protein DEQ43_26525 [Nocardioides bacterium]|nr:hypothetical protein [Nocardioides sp.]